MEQHSFAFSVAFPNLSACAAHSFRSAKMFPRKFNSGSKTSPASLKVPQPTPSVEVKKLSVVGYPSLVFGQMPVTIRIPAMGWSSLTLSVRKVVFESRGVSLAIVFELISTVEMLALFA